MIHRKYLVKDGLPSTETYQIISDQNGFLWIATDAGICRFDGLTFKTFSIREGLPESTVLKLYEDRKGRIWFSTLTSKLGYVYHDSVFVLTQDPRFFFSKTRYLSFTNSFITSFYVDKKDTLWIGTSSSGRLIKIPPPYNQCIPILVREYQDFVVCFNEGKKSSFLYGTYTSPYLQPSILLETIEIDPSGKIKKNNFNLNNEKIDWKIIVPHPRGGYFMCIGKKLFLLKEKKVSLLQEFSDYIISLSCDRNGYLWAGVRSGGVFCFKDPFMSFKADHFLEGISVTSVTMDVEDSYWFSTLESGIIYMPRMDFSAVGDTKDFLQKRVSGLLILPSGRILVQTFSGKLYLKDGDHLKTISTSGLSLHSFPDFPGKVFFSAVQPGYVDLSDNSVHLIDSKDHMKWFLKDYASDLKGNLYASYTSAIVKLDKTKNFDSILFELKSRINRFIIDRQGVFWIGTTAGLVSYDGVNPPFYWGYKDPDLAMRIDMIAEDQTGRLWLATRGGGLLLFDKKKVIKILNKQTGLSSDFCRTVFIDTLNTVWVGTNEGLSHVNTGNYKVDNYSFLNELIPGEINDMKRFGDELWMATSGGVFRFSIRQLENLQVNPSIFITDVSSLVHSKIKDHAVLDHNENFLRFSFLGLSYFNGGKVSYAFKLEGVDATWRNTGKNEAFAEYSLLTPGEYCFKVKAWINSGETARQAVFRFTILTPFWKTYWFIGLVSLSAATVLYWINRTRIKKIQQEEKKKTEFSMAISKLEVKALRAQMNPHFIFNAINSIQKFILKNEKQPAYDFLTKFSYLIRNVLEYSKSDSISLTNEIETLHLYIQLEQLRAANRFTYTITVNPEVRPDHFWIPSMILQPFVENAILHGLLPKKAPGVLRILFLKTREHLQCTIEDNGIGRKASGELKKIQGHQSTGISATFERLELLNKMNHSKASYSIEDKYDAEGNPSGTRVSLLFPLP